LEEDLKTLKKVHNLPTSFGGKLVLYKAYNGNYEEESDVQGLLHQTEFIILILPENMKTNETKT
jgi:hypothetical protein